MNILEIFLYPSYENIKLQKSLNAVKKRVVYSKYNTDKRR